MRLSFDLVAYGILMAILSGGTWFLAPHLGWPMLLTGITATLTGLVWGVIGFRGHQYRRGAFFSLALVSLLLIWVNIKTWRVAAEGSRLAAMPTTLMFVFTVGMAVLILLEANDNSGSGHGRPTQK